MSKFIITATCTLALALVVACHASTGITTTGESSSEPNVVQPEPPAPLQESGKSLAYNFDSDAAGSMPAKFHDALTGKGSRGQWAVKADPTAPSAPNVLAQTSADKTSYRFPVAIADEGSFRDLDLSVRFKQLNCKNRVA
jgi:hypothetical protein